MGNLAAGSHQTQHAIIGAGTLPPLLALLRSDQPTVKASAATALASLGQQNSEAVSAAGAVPPLVPVLRSGDTAVHESTARDAGILQLALKNVKMQSLQQVLCLKLWRY